MKQWIRQFVVWLCLIVFAGIAYGSHDSTSGDVFLAASFVVLAMD